MDKIFGGGDYFFIIINKRVNTLVNTHTLNQIDQFTLPTKVVLALTGGELVCLELNQGQRALV